ncbi:hypothetical protein IWQ49_003322 [Labrenzia sp. EL_126]|nr:hypothetical protein [Labrenzia sp. EL_126]
MTETSALSLDITAGHFKKGEDQIAFLVLSFRNQVTETMEWSG